jgi:hypothetical protein
MVAIGVHAMSDIAQVLVRGSGLLVVQVSPEAEAIVRRPLAGMPLVETITEDVYRDALERVAWTVLTGEPMTALVKAPDGTVGRMSSRAVAHGAEVRFTPVRYAIHELFGPDLICGRGNDVFESQVSREYVGLAAREAFPESVFWEAQDVLAWVMRTGQPKMTAPMPGVRMGVVSPRPGVVRTAAR